MAAILEGIFKGLVQWVFGLVLEIVQYISNSLLDVFGMDLAYFESVAPVTRDIVSIMMAVGWALLLGNLVFQATKSMASGLGFEGEDPKLLFARTFVFSFLLMVSRQVCDIGLGMTAVVIDMLQVPSSVTLTMPEETAFSIGASWLLVIIVGFVIMWQVVKLFFEIGERYVVTALLTILSPLAFGMGGSKNTEDIFKGWARMYGSMCLMMVFNVIFLKLLISALGYMPSGAGVLPWMILVVGIARVGRKIDGIIARIGLNPAITGDGLGRGLPGMLAYGVVRTLGSTVVKTIGKQGGKGAAAGGGTPGGGGPHDGSGGGGGPHTGPVGGGRAAGSGQKRGSYYRSGGGQSAAQPTGAAAGAQASAATAQSTHTSTTAGTAAAPPGEQAAHAPGTPGPAPAGTPGAFHTPTAQGQGRQPAAPPGTAGTPGSEPVGAQRSQRNRDAATRRSSAAHLHTPGVGAFAAGAVLSGMAGSRPGGPTAPGARPGSPGTAGTRPGAPGVPGAPGRAGGSPAPQRPPLQRGQSQDGTAGSGPAAPEMSQAGYGQARFTAVPPQQGKPVAGGSGPAAPGAGTRYSSAERRTVQRSSVTTQSRSTQPGQDAPRPGAPGAAPTVPGVPASPGASAGTAGTAAPASAQSSQILTKQTHTLKGGAPPAGPTRSTQAAPGTGRDRQPPTPGPSPSPGAVPSGMGRNAGDFVRQTPSGASRPAPARQEGGVRIPDAPRQTGKPPSGTAGRAAQPPQPPGQGKGFRPAPPGVGQGTARLKGGPPAGVAPPSPTDKKHRRERGGNHHGK